MEHISVLGLELAQQAAASQIQAQGPGVNLIPHETDHRVVGILELI